MVDKTIETPPSRTTGSPQHSSAGTVSELPVGERPAEKSAGPFPTTRDTRGFGVRPETGVLPAALRPTFFSAVLNCDLWRVWPAALSIIPTCGTNRLPRCFRRSSRLLQIAACGTLRLSRCAKTRPMARVARRAAQKPDLWHVSPAMGRDLEQPGEGNPRWREGRRAIGRDSARARKTACHGPQFRAGERSGVPWAGITRGREKSGLPWVAIPRGREKRRAHGPERFVALLAYNREATTRRSSCQTPRAPSPS